MNIIGIERLYYGVRDMDASIRFQIGRAHV